jgi:hypothetical protein
MVIKIGLNTRHIRAITRPDYDCLEIILDGTILVIHQKELSNITVEYDNKGMGFGSGDVTLATVNFNNWISDLRN